MAVSQRGGAIMDAKQDWEEADIHKLQSRVASLSVLTKEVRGVGGLRGGVGGCLWIPLTRVVYAGAGPIGGKEARRPPVTGRIKACQLADEYGWE